jgi:hypothetical protein
MEHHHFDQCVMILSSEGNNIFQGLSTEEYRYVMKVVEQAILSTDLASYFEKRERFVSTADDGEIDWQVRIKNLFLTSELVLNVVRIVGIKRSPLCGTGNIARYRFRHPSRDNST